MAYRNNSMSAGVFEYYIFEKNLQGDIVAVYNSNGIKLVSYTYDAWGNFTPDYEPGGDSTPVIYNSFRYRGYFYDEDTELYYLNSRYYDPAIGRFINADSIGLLGANRDFESFNLYAYCGNNPVLRADVGGEFWSIVIGGFVSAGIDLAFQLVTNGGNLEAVDLGSVFVSFASGAVSAGIGVAVGAITSKVTSAAGKMAINIVAGGIDSVITDAISGNIDSFKDVGESMLTGMVESGSSEMVSNHIKQLRLNRFKNRSKARQRDILTNKVFKKGNYYYNWTWKTYENTDFFNKFIERGVKAFEYTCGIIGQVIDYVR